MDPLPPRREREFITIEKMIHLYCRARHGTTRKTGLCRECADLLQYAHKRLSFCPFQEEKPACAQCPIHCYAPRRRERIREVMRFAGPRMLFRHPILAIRHQLDALKKPPEAPPGRRRAGGTHEPSGDKG